MPGSRLPSGHTDPRLVADDAAAVRASLLPADWPAPPDVHAFTTLRGPAGASTSPRDRFNLGLRCGDDANAVSANRSMLEAGAGLPSPPRWLRQVHGTRVVRLADDLASGEPEADAAVTGTPGTVLSILTADCLPVLFATDDGSEVGAAHAGWRGLAAGVLEATVDAMRAPPQRLIAWLGPAAGPQAYEVGREVLDAFVTCDPMAMDAFVATRPGHWHADLYALARMRLQQAGVTRVFGGGLCTISDSQRFYSHRRDKGSGRMATLVWRQPMDSRRS